jgi:hypothetical protein
MQLSDESVGRFIEAYKKSHGEVLPEAEARIMATNLINLYRLILQPLPPAKPEEPPRRGWVRSEREEV